VITPFKAINILVIRKEHGLDAYCGNRRNQLSGAVHDQKVQKNNPQSCMKQAIRTQNMENDARSYHKMKFKDPINDNNLVGNS
jgi:hypothetical protein